MPAESPTGFAMIPAWMVTDERITPAQIRVYLVLACHVHQHGTWRLTHEQIGDEANYSRASVKAALTALRELGVVDWETPDPRDPNAALGCVYRIRIDRAGSSPADEGWPASELGDSQPAGYGVARGLATNKDSQEDSPKNAADADAQPSLLPANVVSLKTGPKKRRPTPLPADWAPTPEHVKLATERGVDLGVEADTFRNHAVANDRRAVVWNAAFNQWLLKATPPRHGATYAQRPVRRDGNGRIREW